MPYRRQKHDIMQVPESTNTILGFKSWLEALDFDPEIESYKEKLLDIKRLEKVICVGNQYLYIAELVNPQIVFISPRVKDILGYEPERFYDDLFFLYEIIHPEDRPLILKATQKSMSFAYKARNTKPFENIVSMDYRVKKADGKYIRILRQTGLFSNDKKGNMAFSFAICTDISDIKKMNKIEFSMSAPDFAQFDFPGDDLKQQSTVFTRREKQVIKLLMKGETSKNIAELLYISPLTVISHRKNMIKKTGTTNSSELIAHVVEQGLDE